MPNKINRSDKNKNSIYENLVKFINKNKINNSSILLGSTKGISYNKNDWLPVITDNFINISTISKRDAKKTSTEE